jgi:hypothetical protein
MRNLGGSVSHTKPGQNIAQKIARSTKDELLSPADRNNEHEPESGKGRKKVTKHPGAFDKLKARVRAAMDDMPTAGELTKALREQEGGSATYNEGLDQAALIAKLRSGPSPSSPTKAGVPLSKALAKTIERGYRNLGKTMPIDAPAGTSSLEATYNSDSATMTGGDAVRRQSLAGAKKKRSPDQIRKAAAQALREGRITGAEAIHCEMAANAGKEPRDGLMGKIFTAEAA